MHERHEMQPIATDVRGVRPSLCLSQGSTRLYCAKTAERIKMLFGVNTLGGPRDIVLHGSPDSPTDRGKGPTLTFWDPSRISGFWILTAFRRMCNPNLTFEPNVGRQCRELCLSHHYWSWPLTTGYTDQIYQVGPRSRSDHTSFNFSSFTGWIYGSAECRGS